MNSIPLNEPQSYPSVENIDYIIQNPWSQYWKSEYRATHPKILDLYPMYYLGGMVAYSCALPFRILRVAFEIFRLIALGCQNKKNLETYSIVVLYSAAQVVSALVGCLCPPLAYQLDEQIQAKDGIFHQKTHFELSQWKSEAKELEQDPNAKYERQLDNERERIGLHFSDTITSLQNVLNEMNETLVEKGLSNLDISDYSDELKILTYWILFQDHNDIKSFFELLDKEKDIDEKLKRLKAIKNELQEFLKNISTGDEERVKTILLNKVLEIGCEEDSKDAEIEKCLKKAQDFAVELSTAPFLTYFRGIFCGLQQMESKI